jgi:hypothetical protein
VSAQKLVAYIKLTKKSTLASVFEILAKPGTNMNVTFVLALVSLMVFVVSSLRVYIVNLTSILYVVTPTQNLYIFITLVLLTLVVFVVPSTLN